MFVLHSSSTFRTKVSVTELTLSHMTVDASISCRANESGLVVKILITFFKGEDLPGKSKIGEVDDIAISARPHQAILRLDVSMYVLLRMQYLESLEQLIEKQECRLE